VLEPGPRYLNYVEQAAREYITNCDASLWEEIQDVLRILAVGDAALLAGVFMEESWRHDGHVLVWLSNGDVLIWHPYRDYRDMYKIVWIGDPREQP
jgi:hypothetical protein